MRAHLPTVVQNLRHKKSLVHQNPNQHIVLGSRLHVQSVYAGGTCPKNHLRERYATIHII
jgi:hypothetical protein